MIHDSFILRMQTTKKRRKGSFHLERLSYFKNILNTQIMRIMTWQLSTALVSNCIQQMVFRTDHESYDKSLSVHSTLSSKRLFVLNQIFLRRKEETKRIYISFWLLVYKKHFHSIKSCMMKMMREGKIAWLLYHPKDAKEKSHTFNPLLQWNYYAHHHHHHSKCSNNICFCS